MNPRRVRTALAIALIAIMLALAVTAMRRSSPHRPAPRSAVLVAGGPTGTSIPEDANGPAGEAAARTAAVRLVASSGALVHAGPIGRRELLRPLFAPEAVDGEVEALDRDLDAIASRLGVNPDSLVWVEQPLTARVVLDGDRARVSVWSVVIFGTDATTHAGPALAPTALWRTSEVDLVDRDGVWFAAGVTATAGPTPASDDAARVDGFVRFRDVAAWPAASGGGGGS